MKPDSSRFHAFTPSPYPWEREAIAFLREQLVDADPNRIFALFDFTSHDGKLSEVDTLVLTQKGLYLVEIKSRPGRVTGDSGTWTWHSPEGKRHTTDSPVYLTQKKCQRLKDVLARQRAFQESRTALPFIQPLVFLSAPDLQVDLEDRARHHVCTRGDGPRVRGVLKALTEFSPDERADGWRALIDAQMARTLEKAMAQAGIRPSVRHKRFTNSYELEKLLLEGPGYQDWLARHLVADKVTRRVRIYPVATTTDADSRMMLNRAARREFNALQGIQHQGILKAIDFQEGDQGPGLIFEHDPAAVRLDLFLRDEGQTLDRTQRLAILRQIAEAVRYAHDRRLVHRALSPQSVLIRRQPNGGFATNLYNWQTAARDITTGGSGSLTMTQHVESLTDPAALVYLAPETQNDPLARAEHLDVFGLGGIAWLLFAGRPPADDPQCLRDRLRRDDCLLIAAAVDNVAPSLVELIRESTRPKVSDRYNTVGEFLRQLDAVEKEVARPADEVHENPTAAKVGQRFPGDWIVKHRLGQGSTAVGFLVMHAEDESKQRVLKLALDPGKNETLAAEREVLESLRHEAIVQCTGTLECAGHLGLLLAKAGDESVAHRLRRHGRFELEQLQRFGEDLLSALQYLEEQAVFHRDIKPDNLGIAARGRGDHQHLVLFDFSLAKAPLASTTVGTRAYLDPFLGAPDRRQYDPAAELFAAAVTLFEMATSRLPKWGDGRSAPELTNDEVDFRDESLFPSSAREALTAFFRKALLRNAKDRFDNTEEMLRAWRKTFDRLSEPTTTPAQEPELTLGSPVQLLALSTRAVTVLERHGIDTVQQFLSIPQGRITKGRGVGAKTREELLQTLGRLRTRFPEILPGSELPSQPLQPTTQPESDASLEGDAHTSLDQLAMALVPPPRGRGKAEQAAAQILRDLLELDSDGNAAFAWLTQTEAAKKHNTTTVAVNLVVGKARTRWRKLAALTKVRSELSASLIALGGIQSHSDAAQSLADGAGTDLPEIERLRCARAVLRAAVEAETGLDQPSFELCRRGDRIWLVTSKDADGQSIEPAVLLRFAQELGRRAVELAEAEPLPPPARVLETLQQVKAPRELPPLGPERLIRLAAAAGDVAVSGKLELYPRGMAAARALKLAHGALLGAAQLTLQQVRQRVQSRYPEAQPLPADREKLEALLQPIVPDLRWDTQQDVFRFQSESRQQFTGDRTLGSASSGSLPPPDAPEVVEAREFDRRMEKALQKYLVLMTGRDDHETVRHRLQARFPQLRVLSAEHLLLERLQAFAAERRIEWQAVLDADAHPTGSDHQQELRHIVEMAAGELGDTIGRDHPTAPILLTRLGLLARYGLLTKVVSRLRDRVVNTRAGSEDGLAAAWLLVAANENEDRPMVDGQPIPVPFKSEFVVVPKTWTRNAARGRAG
jgi:serine/threonine protein kinase